MNSTTSITSSAHARRLARSCTTIACALAFATAFATIAYAAPCPPGYRGTYPKCVPEQVQSHRPYTAHSYAHVSGAGTMHAAKPHYTEPKIRDWHKAGPIGPGPVEHSTVAKSQHGIIFVGGKSALNPQPIPPGHALQSVPRPGAPIEKKIGH